MTAAFIDRVAQEDETTGRVRRSPDIYAKCAQPGGPNPFDSSSGSVAP